MLATALGVLSAGLTTTAWLPQLAHSWRSRSSDGISWPYLATMSSGLTAWLAYGALRRDAPLMMANGVSLAFVLFLIGIKMQHRGSLTPSNERDQAGAC